jgi:hypothetical protein
MALNDEQIEDIRELVDSSSMLDLAANYGLSYARIRVIDYDDINLDLDALWLKPELKAGNVRQQIGEAVCEISGLGDFIVDTKDLEIMAKAEETQARITSGIPLTDEDLKTDLGQLNEGIETGVDTANAI